MVSDRDPQGNGKSPNSFAKTRFRPQTAGITRAFFLAVVRPYCALRGLVPTNYSPVTPFVRGILLSPRIACFSLLLLWKVRPRRIPALLVLYNPVI